MTYILAGNGKEADEYVYEHGLPVTTYVIVTRRTMVGRKRKSGDKLVCAGTWAERKDLEYVLAELETAGFEAAGS